MITEQLKKTYFNILIKPETLAKWVRGKGKKWLHSKCWGWAEELGHCWAVLVETCPRVCLQLRELRQLCTQRIKHGAARQPLGERREGRVSLQQCSWGLPHYVGTIPSENEIPYIKQLLAVCDFVSSLHCRDVRLLILEHGRWSMIDKYETLINGLSIESLSSFVKAFKSQLFVEGLVQGNFTSRVSTASAADIQAQTCS